MSEKSKVYHVLKNVEGVSCTPHEGVSGGFEVKSETQILNETSLVFAEQGLVPTPDDLKANIERNRDSNEALALASTLADRNVDTFMPDAEMLNGVSKGLAEDGIVPTPDMLKMALAVNRAAANLPENEDGSGATPEQLKNRRFLDLMMNLAEPGQ